MARSSHQTDENLMMLVSAFDKLVRAGEDSIIYAYRFGSVVHALHQFYSYAEMGRQVDRSGSTVHTYRKLFLRYGSENLLLQASARLGSYDVKRLSQDGDPGGGYHYGVQCLNCGAIDNVKKIRESNETGEVEAVEVSADTKA